MQIKWFKGRNWQISQRSVNVHAWELLNSLQCSQDSFRFFERSYLDVRTEARPYCKKRAEKLSPQIRAAEPNLRYVLLISLLISCFDVSLSITCDLSDVQFVYSKTEDLTLVTTCSLERGNTSGKLNSKYWQMLYYRPHRGFQRKTTEVTQFLCC